MTAVEIRYEPRGTVVPPRKPVPGSPISPGLTCENGRLDHNGPRRRLSPPRGVENTYLRGALVGQRTCAVEGCDRQKKNREYCHPHFLRWRRNGDPGPAAIRPRATKPQKACAVDACDRPQVSRGYCVSHYARWQRTGDAGATAIADPTVGGTCAVDGCERTRKSRGFCQGHYTRFMKTGSPGDVGIRQLGDPRVRDAEGRKQCTRCREWLAVGNFLRHSQSSDGLVSNCYRCHRAGVLRRKYGITIDQYEAMLAKQGGVCAMCGNGNKDGRLLAVDHDHDCCPGGQSCGKCARALLCTRCNTGLGAFGDSVVLLNAAIAYLVQHRASA